MSDPCIKENELGRLQSTVEMVKKEIFNGDNALSKSVPVLSTQVGELTEAVKELRESIDDFKAFKDEIKGGRNIAKRTVMWVTVILAIASLTWNAFNSKKWKKVDTELYFQQQFNKYGRPLDSTTRGGYVTYPEIKNDTI